VCRPLLRLGRPFMIFEGSLDSNPECCCSKLARYRLSHPSLYMYIIGGVVLTAVLWIRIRIRIRIHVFLGLLDPVPDPDSLVRCMDPDPDLDSSNIKQK
jgi:hypothetical protein